MKQKRLLLLLALLMTAATGAWGMQIYISYPAWPSGTSVNGDGNLVLEVELSDSFENLKSKIEDKTEFDPTYMHLFYEGTECPNDETLYAKGVAANSVLTLVYGKYTVALADGTADAGNWTATLGSSTTPQSLPVYTNRGSAVTLNYGGRLKVKSVTATHDGWNGDLSSIPASALDGNTLIVPNGATLKGTLSEKYSVVIPAGATVTLAGVTIEGVNHTDYKWAGITCEGDATIILADDTENTVKGFYNSFPGIQPGPANTTLTITGGEKGTGKLTASSNGWGAGIGAGHKDDITECGNILIKGGIITAIGSNDAAAIGSGQGTKCGDITITNGVTKVTAKKEFSATYRIGPGDNGGTCGTVTIGGTVYWENNAAKSADADAYLKQAEIVYPEPDPLATPLTIEALTAGTIKLDMDDGTLALDIQYSVNGGTKKEIKTTPNITVAKGDKVQFYGNGFHDGGDGVRIQGSGDGFQTKVYGNIMSLLDETGFATKTELPNATYVFYELFAGNTTLIDASELLLPDATLAYACYQSMFQGCTSLTTAPKLPATTLAYACYEGMFSGCTSLTSAYVKAAYTEENYMCSDMFNGWTATDAVLHTTPVNKESWEAKMGKDKDWKNWSVEDDWKD